MEKERLPDKNIRVFVQLEYDSSKDVLRILIPTTASKAAEKDYKKYIEKVIWAQSNRKTKSDNEIILKFGEGLPLNAIPDGKLKSLGENKDFIMSKKDEVLRELQIKKASRFVENKWKQSNVKNYLKNIKTPADMSVSAPKEDGSPSDLETNFMWLLIDAYDKNNRNEQGAGFIGINRKELE